MNKKPIHSLSNQKSNEFVSRWFELADQSHFWMQWRLLAFLKQINDLQLPLDKPLKGLEIGCGNGVLKKQIESQTAWIIDGVDLDYQALETNEECRGEKYFYNIFDKNKSMEEKYDFLVLYDVLEHISDPITFLNACLFHLKKGGYFFINVPALAGLMSRYDQAAGHFRRYNKKTLSEELTKADIDIADLRYWGLNMVPILFIRKLILSKHQPNEKIIERGFKPPHPLVHQILKMIMHMETGIISKPPIGTSLMAAGIKK